MLGTTSLQIPAATLVEFLSFLQYQASGMDPVEAVGEALGQWMDRRRRGETGDTEPKPGGYRWKMLYLPAGTRLSVLERGELGFAYVVDDRLIYHGEDMTPNQFARMALGYVCNAWGRILITLPWDTRPTLASAMRRNPHSPAMAPTPQQVPGVVGRSASGSFIPRRRLSGLAYPRLWPDIERREGHGERRIGAERRVVDALWDE